MHLHLEPTCKRITDCLFNEYIYCFSPSFFNAEEVNLVKHYINELLEARGMQTVKQEEIGVIAPYRKQASSGPCF